MRLVINKHAELQLTKPGLGFEPGLGFGGPMLVAMQGHG